MDWNAVLHLALQYGPLAPVLGYFWLREDRRDKREGETAARIEKRDAEREARWEAIVKDHTESDKNLAVTMGLLAERLNRVRGL